MTGTVDVFLDFDGTITIRDVTDAILEQFADPAWLQFEDAWLSGRIGSRECLAAQMALVTATPEQIDGLLDTIEIDAGLPTLIETCAKQGVPVRIVSDGFDYCINRILQRPDLHVVCSRLRPDGPRWRATFPHPANPCEHGCATCKPAAMAQFGRAGRLKVFVGDGLSDRYAAAAADVVFAKGKLAAYCKSAAISYAPYDTLATVADFVDRVHSREAFPAV